jgi:hypothetical protein
MSNSVTSLRSKSRSLLAQDIDRLHAQLNRLDAVIEKLDKDDPRKSKLMKIRKAIASIAINLKTKLARL